MKEEIKYLNLKMIIAGIIIIFIALTILLTLFGFVNVMNNILGYPFYGFYDEYASVIIVIILLLGYFFISFAISIRLTKCLFSEKTWETME